MKRFWLAFGLMCWCTAAWPTAEVVLQYVIGNSCAYLKADTANAQVAFVAHKTQATPFTIDIVHGIGCSFYLQDSDQQFWYLEVDTETDGLLLIPNDSRLVPLGESPWTWRLNSHEASLSDIRLIVKTA
jgi:hypothetical protein